MIVGPQLSALEILNETVSDDWILTATAYFINILLKFMQ